MRVSPPQERNETGPGSVGWWKVLSYRREGVKLIHVNTAKCGDIHAAKRAEADERAKGLETRRERL